jgi:hypothetical protein
MSARFGLGLVLALAVTGSATPQALACGHCREDKVAATYDYSVITSARRNGQTVVFAELHGSIAPGSPLASWIRQQAEGAAGVARGTVRVSLEPGALSFACDPHAVTAALRAIGEKLARRGLSVTLIEAQAAPGAKVGA